ncbi:MAG: ATP-binding protein [Burkholderiales bacterium]|nr:ATP-binding protein [Burkholderiales bacterium]
MNANIDHQRFAGLDLLTTGILIVDMKGKIKGTNVACEDMTGKSGKVLYGMKASAFFREVPEWLSAYMASKSPSFMIPSELVEMYLGPNATLQVYVSVHPVPDDPELLILEIFHAQKALKLNHLRHMSELSENTRRLLRNLAHEIKNPLGGIRGAAQLLQSELDDNEHKEFTKIVISEADRLQALVDKLLAPYRHAYKPVPINIHEILERVRKLIESEFPVGLQVVRDYDVSVPNIKGDRGQLTQIFLNLMRNSAEALQEEMAEGIAKITLVTRVAHHVMIGSIRHKAALNVHVIDNGEGIPPKIIESIFYPLVSGKESGSGLGLSLVQSFVEQHEGSIEVESQKGRTDFSLMFPLDL